MPCSAIVRTSPFASGWLRQSKHERGSTVHSPFSVTCCQLQLVAGAMVLPVDVAATTPPAALDGFAFVLLALLVLLLLALDASLLADDVVDAAAVMCASASAASINVRVCVCVERADRARESALSGDQSIDRAVSRADRDSERSHVAAGRVRVAAVVPVKMVVVVGPSPALLSSLCVTRLALRCSVCLSPVCAQSVRAQLL